METAAKPSLLDNPNKPKEVKPLEDISSFSITGWLNKKEEVKTEKVEVKDNLPANHFSEVDLLHEWKLFLDNLQDDDPVKFSAIKVCKLQKKDENKILIKVPSEAAKSEFETVRKDFLSVFQQKVNNFHIKSKYVEDETLQKEIITKRKLFDKFAEKNPILKELDDLMKFDFS
ncbi:hypothetical protein [Elizabethkingia sp. M8]|uniref:hypothetical protein n=1 Tax=Elizabethkingia sp. M8 TaxID=2796140 RepID=UPI001F43375F|nr:hypothetical protein [Elizabethkingia sp. M8]